MRFVEVALEAPEAALPRLARLYERLGLTVRPRADGVEVQAGETRLVFAGAAGAPFYHFAFLVPGDRWDAALAWARERVDLLPSASTGEAVFRFESWNAHAVYFHDPAGNIVELIAHRGLDETGARGRFCGSEILGLSELALVGDLAALGAALPLPLWAGSLETDDTLAFVGEKARTLILAPPGRGWLPTDRPAEAHPVEATIEAGRDLALALDGHRLRLVREVRP